MESHQHQTLGCLSQELHPGEPGGSEGRALEFSENAHLCCRGLPISLRAGELNVTPDKKENFGTIAEYGGESEGETPRELGDV